MLELVWPDAFPAAINTHGVGLDVKQFSFDPRLRLLQDALAASLRYSCFPIMRWSPLRFRLR